MKKIKDFFNVKNKSDCLLALLLINIVYVFILGIINTVYHDYLQMAALEYAVLGIINIIAGFVIVDKGFFKKNIVYICMIGIAIFSFISFVFAVKPSVAFFGAYSRYEGLISILYYLTLMFLASFVKETNKKKIAIAIIIFGIIQSIYALLQSFELPFVYLRYNPNNPDAHELWPIGFLRNPNFLGTGTIISLALAIGLFMDVKELKKQIIYAIAVTICMVGLLLSNAASCAVALIAIMLFLLIYSIKNRLFIKFGIIVTIVVITTLGAAFTNKTDLLKDIIRTGNEAVEISKGNMNDNYGTKRLYIWKETLKVVPQHLLHGAGIDNFSYAFNGSQLMYQSYKTFTYDKAHNEYLQILVTEGIFCLISYLAMYAIICIRGLKVCFSKKKTYLILPIMAYLVQAFFNISVIIVAPLFYILLGLCIKDE